MKPNCWEVKHCGREPGGANAERDGVCPATLEVRLNGVHGGKNAGRSCWIVGGTLCEGEVQGTHALKFGFCEKCGFYKQVQQEEFPNYSLSSTLLIKIKPEDKTGGPIAAKVHDRSGKPGLEEIGGYIKSRSYGAALIREVLANKGRIVRTVSPETTVFSALGLLARYDIGALVVVEGEDKVIGVVSERDYAKKVILCGRNSKETPVRDIMSSPVQSVSLEDSVSECMSLMTAGHLRHLPVCRDGHLIGIVSMGDLVNAFIAGKDYMIEQYEKYIHGSYPA